VLALAGGATAALATREGGNRAGGPETAARSAPASTASFPGAPARSAPASGAAPAPPAPHVVAVRRAGGVPDGWAARLARIAGVSTVARVRRAQAMLRRTTTRSGARSSVRAGYAVALDTFVVPRAYAAVLPASERPALRRLRPGAVLLSRTSARVRRAGVGSTLTLVGGRRLRVVGVLDDALVRAAELVVGTADGRRLGAGSPSLIAAIGSDTAVRRVRRAFRGARTRVTDAGPAPWAPSGRIVPSVLLKQRFGEFALRLPVGRDWVAPDPAWRRRNIVTRRVPVLGPVTCHRRMIPVLRRALATLRRRGLARLVDPGDYAGCYAPRRIPASGSLSLHAFGLAVDLNASRNPQGSPPRQDRRLVRVMERAGLWWGGRWPTVPDGMHFEFHGPDDPPRELGGG
jgi:hypothetical protein